MILALTGKSKEGNGGLAIFCLLLFALAAAAAGEILWPLALLPNGCGPSAMQEEKAAAEIEDVIEDFYDDLIDGKYTELPDYCTGDAKEAFEDAIEMGLQNPFVRYREAKLEEVGRIRIKGEEASARAELEIAGETVKEDFELEYDDGDWLISEWEALEPLQNRGTAETAAVGEEAAVRNAADAFLTAFSNMAFDSMLAMMTEEFAAENRPMMDQLRRTDPETLEGRKPVSWTVERVFVEGEKYRLNISVRLKNNPDRSERLAMELTRVEQDWKVSNIRSYWYIEGEGDEPDVVEPS